MCFSLLEQTGTIKILSRGREQLVLFLLIFEFKAGEPQMCRCMEGAPGKANGASKNFQNVSCWGTSGRCVR